MDLTIQNFARIEQAEIKIDGITVIAGENNTGKSTVGKILYSLFNMTYDFDKQISRQRKQEVRILTSSTLQNYIFHNLGQGMSRSKIHNVQDKIKEYIFEQWDENSLSEDDLRENCARLILSEFPEIDQAYQLAEELAPRIMAVMEVPDDRIRRRLLTEQFGFIFSNQVSPRNGSDVETELCLTIKGKEMHVMFKNDICTAFTSDYRITHRAIYIESPSIIDDLDTVTYLGTRYEDPKQFLKYILTKDSSFWDGVFQSVLAEDKLRKILETLNKVIPGDIVENSDEEYFLTQDGLTKPIAFKNLSTGLKSFVILKMLLEHNVVREKDVLIFDEPEIHLHPQWQLVYAELIVLLQKYFDLSIVVTTHSPYFLDALNLYSIKHEVDSKVNYYLSYYEDGFSGFEDVTQNLDAIYKKMSSPIDALDRLRESICNREDEQVD